MSLRNSATGAMLAAIVGTVFAAPAWCGDTPRPSPPFTIMRQGAPNIELKQYRGKVVVLAFIYTTCPHCQDLTRAMSAVSKEYAGKDVQFLECAFNTDALGTLPQFMELFRPPFPVGYSFSVPVRTYLQVGLNDGLFMVPHLVFLDRGGVIRKDVRAQDEFFKDIDGNFRAEINQLLTPPKKKAAAGK